MHKSTYFGLILGWLAGAAAAAPLGTAPTAHFLNVEMPFRCSAETQGELEVSSTLPLRAGDFKLAFFDRIDALPAFEVNGFSFKSKQVDEALQLLLDEAGIEVFTEDGSYPALNASDVYGELSAVVEELANAGGVFYRYNSSKKELYLSRRGRFELQLPPDRFVMLAMLDALRGADIKGALPDWERHTLLLTLTREDYDKTLALIDTILQDSYLLLADTQVYRATPRHARAGWQQVIERFGVGRVDAVASGLVGHLVSIGHQPRARKFLRAMGESFRLDVVSRGTAIVPNGWKMRFSVGQCALSPRDVSTLSMLVNARIRTPQKVETAITLDTRAGEVSTFTSVAAIDDELVILGIPSLDPADAPGTELLLTLKLRLIRLIQER